MKVPVPLIPDEVFRRLDAGQQPQQGIFFDGQIFDAYTFVSDIIRSAKKSIVLFDWYAPRAC